MLSYNRYIWASGADGAFTVSEDDENEDLGRGTLIKIHLKEDAQVSMSHDRQITCDAR
jgi:HSP90 family molecular chaperone